jgi:hypothetical protein
MADTTVAELDREAMRRIARTARVNAEVQGEEGMLVTGPEAQIRDLLRIVRSLISEDERDEQLLDVLLQNVEPGVMGPEHMLQLRTQAEAREAFLKDVPLLDSASVAELLGSTARNTSAMASRLKREGKLFAITYRGVDLYPAAQIVDGEPSPFIPQILKAFSGDSPWTAALWLNAPSGWLGGKRPLDLLATEPDRVVQAARKTTEALRF